MTAVPLALTTPVPVPDWDPGPRPPRWTLALTALLLVIAGTAFGLHRLVGLIGTPHPVRADICPALDRGPLTAALGDLDFDGKPGAPERRDGRSRAVCVFLVDGDGTLPRAMGSILVDWYDYAVLADLQYAAAEGAQAKSFSSAPYLAGVPDLGDQAFAAYDPDYHEVDGRRLRRFEVTAREGNVLLNLSVAVPDAAEGVPWPETEIDAARSVLTVTARTALQRVL